MFVTVNTASIGEPDVTGFFESEEEAFLFLCGMVIDAGIVESREEAEIYVRQDENLFVVPVSEPSPTSLTGA